MSVKELVIASILILCVLALFFWMGMIIGERLIKAPLIREWRAYHEAASRIYVDHLQYIGCIGAVVSARTEPVRVSPLAAAALPAERAARLSRPQAGAAEAQARAAGAS